MRRRYYAIFAMRSSLRAFSPPLSEWLSRKGASSFVDASIVEIASFGLMGRGLRTVVPASKGDCLLEIPSTVWERFSAAKARASIDGALPML